MKRGPTNESVELAVVGSVLGFGDKMDGTVIVKSYFEKEVPYIQTTL
jgi:hypothetical protein